jgi:hypothetical protein
VIENLIFAKPDVHPAIDLGCRELVLPKPEVQNGIDAHLVVIGDRRTHALAQQFDRHLSPLLVDPNATQFTFWTSQTDRRSDSP